MIVTKKGIEIHAVHSCNLRCSFCTHYSNITKGIVSVEEADLWMKAWCKRIKPNRFTILGGEPLLHPEICRFIQIARSNWGNTKLHLVTNGLLLSKHPALPATLKECRPIRLVLSNHPNSQPAYAEKFANAVDLAKSWAHACEFEVEIVDSVWKQYYRFKDSKMLPFCDNDPKGSYSNCPNKACINLFDYKLYKCPNLAYLKLLKQLDDAWTPYLQYQPLNPSCSDQDLKDWLLEKEIPECNMCPAQKHWVQPETQIPLL